MQTSREDVGIAIRSAFLAKGSKQRFSLLGLIILSIVLLFLESLETKPLNYFRSFVKDAIYRSSVLVSSPINVFKGTVDSINKHIQLYDEYEKLRQENKELRSVQSKTDFLEFENTQLRKLIDEPTTYVSNFVSARVMLDKQSPYLNSFILNIGSNKKIKNGMEVLEGENFIGRIVDVNFFSSRVLLISDLNSKIPVVIEPSGFHAILNGKGKNRPTLEYLPENHDIQGGNRIYTSGKEGIFSAGIPIGEVVINNGKILAQLFSDLNQITFVNINLGKLNNN